MSADFVIITTAILVVVPCALLGTLLVLRQMAMVGDAISHAVLPGIVFAFFISESLGPFASLVGAAAFGLICAFLIEALKNTGRVKEDSSIGIVFTALFALGVFLISRFASEVHIDLQHVLYGEIAFAPLNTLLIGGMDLGPRTFWTLGIVTFLAVAFVLLFYKELKIATFDAGLAAAVGLSPVLVHYLLMGAVSVTVVGAFDAVGAILVVALLIAPAATAYLLTEQLRVMMALAVAAGVASAVSGYYVAALFDVSISGMMATMAGVFFALAVLFSPTHGIVAAASRRRKNSRDFSRDLLLAKAGSLGEKTTEEDLADSLGWDSEKVSRSLDEASRRGFIERPSNGGISMTKKGRDAARERAESLV